MTLDEKAGLSAASSVASSQPGVVPLTSPLSPLSGRPAVHRAVEAPLCASCRDADMSFFDVACVGCRPLLSAAETTLPQLYAILRQWTPQTQKNIELIVNEVRGRGGHLGRGKGGHLGRDSQRPAAILVGTVVDNSSTTFSENDND